MEPLTVEEMCEEIRGAVLDLGTEVACLHARVSLSSDDGHLDGVNVPPMKHANMHANITLAFRHLEDARMRLGKVMQASQGGVSIFDKK